MNGRPIEARLDALKADFVSLESQVASLRLAASRDIPPLQAAIPALQSALRAIEVLLSEMAATDPTPGLSWQAKETLKSDHHFWQLERKENSLEWKRKAAVRLAIQAAIAGSMTTALVAFAAARLFGAHL